MSRSSTRSFTGSREPRSTLFPYTTLFRSRSQAIDTLAHRIDTAQELLALVARHEIGAFVPQVLREVLQRGAGGPAAPVKREAGEASELMRRHIPEQQRQFFLEVRAQEPGQLAELLCHLRIAADRDLARQHGVGGLAGERQQAQGPARERGVRRRVVARHGEGLTRRWHPQARDIAYLERNAPALEHPAQRAPRVR